VQDTEDLLRDAEKIGRRNAEIIELAQAWCRHVRRDRGRMGVGIVEQQTGLPVSGGTFRCDFARNPGLQGMDLASIAFAFYERNCANCKDRSPTGIVPNLGTWAAEIADKRREVEEKSAQALKAREADRAERHRRRRLRAGRLSAVAQSTIELLEKLDTETPDRSALTELLALARLHPEGFTPDLLEVVLTDAAELRSEACLEVVATIRQSRGLDLAGVAPVALKGLRQGWGHGVSASLAAAHATAADVDDELFRAAVLRASSPLRGFGGANREPNPDVLVRLWAVAPERCMALLIAQISAKDDWRRAAAAQAASCLFDTGSLQPTETLVDCLLDAARLPDQMVFRPAEARSAVQGAVASAMQRSPSLVEGRIEPRWADAVTRDRLSLLECYDDVIRSNLGKELPPEIPTATASRAISCLTDADPDVISKAADLVDLVFGYHASATRVPIDVVLGSLALVCRAHDSTPSGESRIVSVGAEQSIVSAFDREQRRSALSAAATTLTSAVSALAPFHRDQFWSGLDALWAAELGDSPRLKGQLTLVLGKVAAEPDSFGRALPYLYSALLGSEQAVRARAIAAFSDLLDDEPGSEMFPEAVTLGIIAGLSDQYVIVIAAACTAIRYVSIPPDLLFGVLNRLIGVAANHATEPRFWNMVLDALRSASSLAAPTQYKAAVDRAILRVADSMQPYYALEVLSYMPSLSERPEWLASAIKALRPNAERGYDDLRDDDKDSLMRKIASHAPDRVSPHVPELLDTAVRAISTQPYKAWRIADLLSALSFHTPAGEIADKALTTIPDTPANTIIRSQTAALRACFLVEAAAARGDSTAVTRALDEWATAQAAWENSEQEARNARPFWPTFIPQ
jgi:hypothetical protein